MSGKILFATKLLYDLLYNGRHFKNITTKFRRKKDITGAELFHEIKMLNFYLIGI